MCENQVTELFVIDRADKKFVSEYSNDLNKPALYILVNRDKRQLYVGETDDSIKRLRNHEAKDFWTEAIVFHSTTDTLSTTEVKWLEAKTYEALKELGYYDLSENKQVPQQPPLKRNQIYTLEPIFEEANFPSISSRLYSMLNSIGPMLLKVGSLNSRLLLTPRLKYSL